MPQIVLNSDQFARVSPAAIKLLLDLLAQYRGDNNGRLSMTWDHMHRRGWKSRDTLAKARRELIDGGWIVQTVQGGLHQPSRYAVTFYALDSSPDLEMTTAAYPRGAWAQSPEKRERHHAGRANSPGIDTPGVRIRLVAGGN